MLIFEGPDNSGKSTIASYISYKLDIPLHHFGKPPKTIAEIENRLMFMLDNHDRYIFDRIPLISEPVYSILRTIDLIGQLPEGGRIFYSDLEKLKPLIVYCRPPIKVLLEESHKGKERDSLEHLVAIKTRALELIERYDEIMDREFSNAWLFDYTKQEHDIFLLEIQEELKDRKHYKWREIDG